MTGFVFTNPETSSLYRDYNVQNAFEAAIRRANAMLAYSAKASGSKSAPSIEDLHFHDGRRAFASRLAQRGVSLQTIADLLGHSAMYVTLRYAWLQPENLRAAVAVLSKSAKILPSDVSPDSVAAGARG